MGESGSVLFVPDPLLWLRDPAWSPHAAGEAPAWLWSAGGARILWSNAVAAAIFGAPNPAALAGPIDSGSPEQRRNAARQIAALAATLPADGAMRLERLHG